MNEELSELISAAEELLTWSEALKDQEAYMPGISRDLDDLRKAVEQAKSV